VGKHAPWLAGCSAIVAGLGLSLAFAGSAQAAEPAEPETRTVTTHVVNREDHGHGSPPPAVWALDTFDRTVTLTGGPGYVLPTAAAAETADAPTIDSQIAETKKEYPQFTLCDLVKHLHLIWAYHAVVEDDGTFVTKAGATLSPNNGAALLGGMPGTMEGGFTADLLAPAHWCTFDASDLDGETVDGSDAPSTPTWVPSLFGSERKAINDDWAWTYRTCIEKWWDAADEDSNDGQSEEAGDITGLPCPTTPAPTTPPVVINQGQLPVTGASVTSVIGVGAGLVLTGILLIVGLFVSRRRAHA
jgi:hypothetical protein